MFKIFNKNRKRNDFDASETFIDSKNLAGFDSNKFDGVLERPLGKMSFLGIFFVFLLVLTIFFGKAFYMQIIQGEYYLSKSIGNFKKFSVLFSERGVVFDRNEKELIWNEKNIKDSFSKRIYTNNIGFSHILGFLSYPQKDKSGKFFEKEYIGKAGVEKYFNNELNGKLGKKIIEIDSFGKVVSENKLELPEAGKNIYLSIDMDIQKTMAYYLNKFIKTYNYEAGSAVLMNVKTGEIIAMVSLPEYDSNILTNGKNKKVIKSYIFDKKNPFLNRATLGEFAPGSIVKPFTALRALKEKIIDPNEKIFTNGKIIIPNPYHPDKPSIFRDYHDNGILDMKKAIAVSSNIYFYILGGGFEGRKGLGINVLHKNFTDFGFGEKTGIFGMKEKKGLVPSIEWKKKVFGTNWNIGNTYYTAIGQFGFLVTPLQVVTAISAIANEGEVLVPKLLKNSKKEVRKTLNFDDKSYKIVKSGMREAVLSGTARLLNFSDIKIAAKTGTAERGVNRDKVNSWVTGFFPYNNPKYAFVFLAENGSAKKLYVVSYAAHQFFKEIIRNGSLEKLLKE